MILYDSRAANSSSPRIRRAKTPFARFSCTKPAICAGAVNHPHHINPMNHSSDKCQRTLVHALTPVNPFHPPQKGLQPPALCPPARPARPARPRARPSTTARLPSCAKNFFAQSLVNSRPSLVRALIPVQPLHPPPKALQRGPYSPGPRRDARGLRQPPVCPVDPKISHTISHILSSSLAISRASLLPVNPFNRPKNASNVNPV